MTRVLFVCVKNGGKSQMAAALMRQHARGAVLVDSAGTHPGNTVNAVSAQALQELGIDISDQIPQAITSDLVTAADVVITLGRDAVLEPVPGTPIVNWDTDEPSLRGIQGIERMRIIRDDIAVRIQALIAELTTSAGQPSHPGHPGHPGHPSHQTG
jgi:arsenate-mycothiol transferase